MAGLYRTGMLAMAKWLLLIGAEAFLFGFSLLLLMGIGMVCKAAFQQANHYFSANVRLQRQLAFNILRRNNLLQSLTSKLQQQLYLAEFKRKRLSRTDSLKQSKQLSKIIQQDLRRLKNHISKNAYRQLQAHLKHCIRQQDVAGLLRLQQQIIAYDSHNDAGSKTLGDCAF